MNTLINVTSLTSNTNNNNMRASFSFVLLLLLFISFTTIAQAAISTTTINIGLRIETPSNTPNLKSNQTDTLNIMYVGNYALSDTKVQIMRFAVDYINNMPEVIPNTRLALYGVNTRGDRATATSGVFAGYWGYGILGFIGAESYSECVALQMITGAYYVPQINPSTVEESLSDPKDYPSLFSIIPPSSDQQMVIIALMKKLGIKTALIITTNNEYGNEMSDMMYNVEAIKLNLTFLQVTLDTNASDFAQKIGIIQEKLPFYRYVVMHCTTATGMSFLQLLYNKGLVGPDYLYIFTHQMTNAAMEKSAYAPSLPLFNGAIGISARYNSSLPFSNDVRAAWAAASPTTYSKAGQDVGSAWFAFDAVYAYAMALQRINKTVSSNGFSKEQYYNQLILSNFVGVTGNISVNSTAARRIGLWDVFNFVVSGANETFNGTTSYVLRGIGNGKSTDLEESFSNFTFFGGRSTLPPPYIAPIEPLKIRSFITALSGALGAIVGISMLVALFALVMLGMHWRMFARHGSFYSAVILGGVIIGLISAFLLLPEPTDSLCVAFPWFLGVGFTLVYGCLFIKTWILYRVWLDAEKFKKTSLSPVTIMKGIGFAVFVEVIFLIVWTIIDPPQAKLHKMVDGYYMLQCETKNRIFWGVFTGIKGVWLIFGAILSILTRRIMVEFNHSSKIAYAIYNIFVLLVIGVPLALTLEDIPGGRLIIQVAVVVIGFTFTIVSLFFGVWYRIFIPEDTGPTITVTSHSGSGSIRSVSHTKSSISLTHSSGERSSRNSVSSMREDAASAAQV